MKPLLGPMLFFDNPGGPDSQPETMWEVSGRRTRVWSALLVWTIFLRYVGRNSGPGTVCSCCVVVVRTSCCVEWWHDCQDHDTSRLLTQELLHDRPLKSIVAQH